MSTPTTTIAVAGGTGGIGRAIVEELVAQGHKVVILSRKASPTPIPGIQVPALATDYSNIESMKQTIISNNITTIISALMLSSPQASRSQLNLIHASIQSSTVHTFIPTEYGINYTPSITSFHPAAQFWLDAADLLRSSHLRYTRIVIGWLLDSHGHPKFKSHAKWFKYVLDFEKRVAVLPGEGVEKVSVLHSLDIARYVAAMVGEGQGARTREWPEISAFAGDVMSWGEMVEVAERVMGEKWTISHDPISKLEKGEGTLLEQPEGSYEGFEQDALRHMVSEFGLMSVKGLMDISDLGLRNHEFPEIKPITIEQIIGEAWGKKDE